LQSRMMTTFAELSDAAEIMGVLQTSSECIDFLPYLDTMDPDMIEVAALLTKKWARR
jgi:hypothetical protein